MSRSEPLSERPFSALFGEKRSRQTSLRCSESADNCFGTLESRSFLAVAVRINDFLVFLASSQLKAPARQRSSWRDSTSRAFSRVPSGAADNKEEKQEEAPKKERRADSALQWMSIIPIKSNKTISKKLWMKNTSRNQTWKGKEKRRHSCNCQNGKVREMEKQMERKLQIQRKQICNSSNLAKPNTGTTRPGIENENFTFLFDFWDPKKKDSCQFNNTKQREKKRQKNNINSKNNKNKQRKS